MPFLRPKKDEKRHEKLVRAIRVGDIRYGSLNLAGVTEDFMKYNSKIAYFLFAANKTYKNNIRIVGEN